MKTICTLISCLMLASAGTLSAQPFAPQAGQNTGTDRMESAAIVIGVGAIIATIILLTSEHNGHSHAHAH